MTGARAATVPSLLFALLLAGCLLPEFENGPDPATLDPGDAGGTADAFPESSPPDVVLDLSVPDEGPVPIDAPDVLLPEADVIETEAGFCETQPDGAVCGPGDACHEEVCQAGQCVLVAIPDGVECGPAPNECWLPGRCQAGVCNPPTKRPDGFNWDGSDPWRRCCNGEPLRMDTNENCGVCGISCDPTDGQSCKLNPVNVRYYCEGCNASVNCWSGCCSTSFGLPYRCAASDCEGNCIACPGTSTCVNSGGQASLVCVYP